MGAVFALFAGFYYWAGKIVGKQYNEILGQIHFWIMFIGVRKLAPLKFCLILGIAINFIYNLLKVILVPSYINFYYKNKYIEI